MKLEWQGIAQSVAQRVALHLREKDKHQHFLYSLVILLGSYCVLSLALSIIVTLLIGLGKEIWDHYCGSGFCWWDLLANGVGIVAGLLLIAGFNLGVSPL